MPRGGGQQKGIKCSVTMLDETILTFNLPTRAVGEELYLEVFKSMQMFETDYFGLEYIHKDGFETWLDREKGITKQCVLVNSTYEFQFQVKFYTPDPTLLEDEFTRYQFALQIKRDLSTGRMHCNLNTTALLLSYIAQAELGDLQEDEADPSYLRDMQYVPNQSEELESEVMRYHLSLKGVNPADADFSLLDTARKTDFYGIWLHPAKDHEGVSLNLAVVESGILVFQNNQRINTFSWARIRKLSFKRLRFLIKLQPSEEQGYQKNMAVFHLGTRNECKHFWKVCVEHHSFFRSASAPATLPRPRRRRVSLQRGSSFRYTGRTQKQLLDHVKDSFVKPTPFERTLSSRASSRRHLGAGSTCTTLNSRHPDMSGSVGAVSSLSSGSHMIASGSTTGPVTTPTVMAADGGNGLTSFTAGTHVLVSQSPTAASDGSATEVVSSMSTCMPDSVTPSFDSTAANVSLVKNVNDNGGGYPGQDESDGLALTGSFTVGQFIPPLLSSASSPTTSPTHRLSGSASNRTTFASNQHTTIDGSLESPTVEAGFLSPLDVNCGPFPGSVCYAQNVQGAVSPSARSNVQDAVSPSARSNVQGAVSPSARSNASVHSQSDTPTPTSANNNSSEHFSFSNNVSRSRHSSKNEDYCVEGTGQAAVAEPANNEDLSEHLLNLATVIGSWSASGSRPLPSPPRPPKGAALTAGKLNRHVEPAAVQRSRSLKDYPEPMSPGAVLRDDDLLAECERASRRGTLRSTRSADEEMVDMMEVGEIAARVMESDVVDLPGISSNPTGLITEARQAVKKELRTRALSTASNTSEMREADVLPLPASVAHNNANANSDLLSEPGFSLTADLVRELQSLDELVLAQSQPVSNSPNVQSPEQDLDAPEERLDSTDSGQFLVEPPTLPPRSYDARGDEHSATPPPMLPPKTYPKGTVAGSRHRGQGEDRPRLPPKIGSRNHKSPLLAGSGDSNFSHGDRREHGPIVMRGSRMTRGPIHSTNVDADLEENDLSLYTSTLDSVPADETNVKIIKRPVFPVFSHTGNAKSESDAKGGLNMAEGQEFVKGRSFNDKLANLSKVDGYLSSSSDESSSGASSTEGIHEFVDDDSSCVETIDGVIHERSEWGNSTGAMFGNPLASFAANDGTLDNNSQPTPSAGLKVALPPKLKTPTDRSLLSGTVPAANNSAAASGYSSTNHTVRPPAGEARLPSDSDSNQAPKLPPRIRTLSAGIHNEDNDDVFLAPPRNQDSASSSGRSAVHNGRNFNSQLNTSAIGRYGNPGSSRQGDVNSYTLHPGDEGVSSNSSSSSDNDDDEEEEEEDSSGSVEIPPDYFSNRTAVFQNQYADM